MDTNGVTVGQRSETTKQSEGLPENLVWRDFGLPEIAGKCNQQWSTT